MTKNTVLTHLSKEFKQFDAQHSRYKKDVEKARTKLDKAIEDYVKKSKNVTPDERKDLWSPVKQAQENFGQAFDALLTYEEKYKEHIRRLWQNADKNLRQALESAWRK